MQSPIDSVVWRAAAELKPNHYNPNYVMTVELEQIERNLIRWGWVQPVIITPQDVIIDGFHRTMLSMKSERVRAKFAGQVPTVVLDVSPAQAMFLTVRMNRAKGTHAAVRMADVVRELIDVHKCDPAELVNEMGMTTREVELLYENSIFVSKGLDKAPYSRAWVPGETRND